LTLAIFPQTLKALTGILAAFGRLTVAILSQDAKALSMIVWRKAFLLMLAALGRPRVLRLVVSSFKAPSSMPDVPPDI
jgi:hypothetical protein